MSSVSDQLQRALGTAYRIERELGGGGMSHVYLAEEVALGRRVVIKVLPPDMAASVSVDRFRREIQLAAQLRHPGIVPLLTAGADGDLLWYVMPYVEGESLRTRLARGPLPIDEAVRLWRDLLEALEYAHGRGIVHRDIKPENLMLTGRRAVTLDFGVAKAVTASTGAGGMTMTGVGLAIGTPAYMAPEQAAGDGNVDARADLYAAGLVLYEMLAGRGPFEARTPAEMMAAQIATVPGDIRTRRPEVSEALAATLMQCLAKTPEQRPMTAAAVLAQLDMVATRSGATAATPRAGRRRGVQVGAVAFVVLAGAAFAWWRTRGAREDAPSANTFASLADSSRLQVAFLPVVAEPQDSVLARTLVSAQIKSLQGDRRILLQTPDQIASIAASVNYPATASTDSLKTLYRDLGIHAYVVHTIARTGNGALLVAEGYATKNDSVLFRVEAPANSAADLSNATATLTRGTLAEALHGFGKVTRPESSGRLFGTTAEAAKIYLEAQEYGVRRDYLTVARKMRLALSIDSNFVQAWTDLAAAVGNGTYSVAERLEAERQAYRLRERTPLKAARVYNEALYLRDIGDLEGALAAAKEGVRQFPQDLDLQNVLGSIYRQRRDFELAARQYRIIAEGELRTRQISVGPSNLATALIQLGRVTEAESLSRHADSVVGRLTVNTAAIRFLLAQAKYDVEGIAQSGGDRLSLATSEQMRLPGYTSLRSAMAMSGRLDSASRLEAKRRDIVQKQVYRLLGVQSIANDAWRRAALLGDQAGAKAALDAGLAEWKWTDLPTLDRGYSNIIAARLATGEIAEARRLADEWERGVPKEFARVQRPLIETARGEIALESGNAREALAHFRAGDVGPCVSCAFPRYARAYDAIKQSDSTIYWYEQYLATPTLNADVDARELPRAYRRLGELYEAKGDTKRAIQRYSDFVELWKNADPALQPLVKDVRDRIARLQRKAG
jgi:tetratricopeptide (TPR) repeat protein/tRNA A-37 threonylcarbamoyl transferase component Bud32